jgi:hypothetical protein
MSIANAPRAIYPTPKSANWYDGEIIFSTRPRLQVFSPSGGAGLAECFEDMWKRFTFGTGKAKTACATGTPGFSLSVGGDAPVLPEIKAGDTYALRVDAGGVAARAVDEKSLLHAWMTLIQLLHPRCLDKGKELFAVPHVEIGDSPALAFRGLHLCVFPETSLVFIERILRLAGLLKYSHVVLEFWGMLKLDSFPLLAWPQAFSKEQVRPIIDAARQMGVEVVPMFNHWGHAAGSRSRYGRHVVLDQDPSKALLFEPDGWTWCLSNPDSLKIMSEVRAELSEVCGEGKYFHLGCDEAYSHATCDLCRKKNAAALLGDFLNSVSADLVKGGRRGIIWGDALLDSTKWEKPITATSRPDQRTHEALPTLSRDLVIADWQYSSELKEVPSFAHFKEQGFDVLLSPWFHPDNIITLGKTAAENGGLGILETTWHTLPEHPYSMLEAAVSAWSGSEEAFGEFRKKGPFNLTNMASLLRKLVPAEGDYKNSGWNSFEVTG